MPVPAPLIRPIGPDEVDLFTSFADASPLGIKPPREMYLDGFRRWYRPEWSWVALRGGEVIARVAFTGSPDADRPEVMGSLEIGTRPDRIETGTLLARTAYAAMSGPGERPRYHQFLPVDWHERADCRAAVEDRLTVARNVGLTYLTERLQLGWVAATGLPPRAGRLAFRPPADDAAVLDLVGRTFTGTLDSRTRREAESRGLDAAVRSFVDELPDSRPLWRLGYDAAGACVGLVVPDLGAGRWGPDIAYLGVLPEHRGRGYAGDLLVEASHLLVERGAEDIGATTDVGNVPMAAAFARCGYEIVDRLIVHV
jgi:ribosomal protein S18 acetylase RimI-like enzyme